jgi:hypothetical protein
LVAPLPDVAQDKIVTNHDISSDECSVSSQGSYLFLLAEIDMVLTLCTLSVVDTGGVEAPYRSGLEGPSAP